MRTTQFDNYWNLYERLILEFDKLEHEYLLRETDSWKQALKEIKSELAKPNTSVKKSDLIKGMQQGLQETYFDLSSSDFDKRNEALKIFREVVDEYAPQFFEKNKKKCDDIIARGKIRNDSEYYLIRQRLEELEYRNIDSEAKDRQDLDQLLANYEL